jgi:hypothetical protein
MAFSFSELFDLLSIQRNMRKTYDCFINYDCGPVVSRGQKCYKKDGLTEIEDESKK